MLFLCYSKCSTCKKAKKWLDDNGISYTERPIKEENPTYEELTDWIGRSGLPIKKFFNTSGQMYRALQLKDKLPSMSKEELAAIRDMMTEHLPKVLEAHNLNMIYFMLTDILAESTELLCVGTGARGIALSAFDLPDNAKSLILKGVVSRKKQLIPVLVETMQQM